MAAIPKLVVVLILLGTTGNEVIACAFPIGNTTMLVMDNSPTIAKNKIIFLNCCFISTFFTLQHLSILMGIEAV